MSLQPLRVPNGWLIEWNTLFEEDPNEPNADGYYKGDPNLFLANHERRLHAIDIAWRTLDGESTGGYYRLQVVHLIDTQPGTPRRHRIPASKHEVDWENPIRVFETASLRELVVELEAWLLNASPRV